jgi:LDH2 family malate/lactate/ureidoglycolate dehydrogenase
VTAKDALPICAILYSKITKHIDVSFHYAREAMAMGLVGILYVESAHNVADI